MYNCCKHHHCPPHHTPYPPGQPSIPVAPPLPGGWTSWQRPTREEVKLFYLAIQGLIGLKYTPYAVQSQVVAGTIFLFLAKTEVFTANGLVIGLVTVQVNVDLQGNIVLDVITPIGN